MDGYKIPVMGVSYVLEAHQQARKKHARAGCSSRESCKVSGPLFLPAPLFMLLDIQLRLAA